MKKIIKRVGRIFHHIGSFFDRLLVTPITKLILKIMNFFKGNAKAFDRLAGKKSTLLIVSLDLELLLLLIRSLM